MPSHLTRHVFRRLLANEPILHRGCLRRQAYGTARRTPEVSRRCTSRNASFVVTRPQRRTMFDFNMFGPKKREVKEAAIDPGIEDMMHLAKVQRMNARLPPPEDIAAAVSKFIKYKLDKKETMTDTQAQLALQAWRYCLEADKIAANSAKPLVRTSTVLKATRVLGHAMKTQAPSNAHVEFSKSLFEHATNSGPGSELHQTATRAYVKILCASGQASLAKQVVADSEERLAHLNSTGQSSDGAVEEANEDASLEADPVTRFLTQLWTDVLRGFADGDNEGELLATLDTIKTYWPNVQNRRISRSMFDFYLRQDKCGEVKRWFQETWQLHAKSGQTRPGEAEQMGLDLNNLLHWCLRSDELHFGHQAVRQAMSQNPPKPVWDAIFVWAAGTGKGADEIGRMLGVMEKSNEPISNPEDWRIPDINTINRLVEFATSKNDPYLAERFIALGKDRGIQPDARTYQLQMDYRLKINDLDGALVAYKNLQTMDLSSGQDISTVNHLIRALCRSKRHDFDTVMNVAMDLSDRRASFEPKTVATLAILHLSRDEMHDVVDLLNTHANRYSSIERESIRDTILAFCLDPKTPTSRSWDAYIVIRSVFDETTLAQRTEMMKNFFIRERPDMAVNMFYEMRRHTRANTIPTIDTYVAAFLGSAKLGDLNSLEITHNQLKLDYNIDVNTYLRNALILAYTACGEARKALTFWSDIAASKEGPTYNSIHIALRACEKSPFGDIRAKEIWARLRKMNIDLDQSMWASYAGALAGNGDTELAITTIEQAEENNEVEVDAFLIGSLCNGANNEAKQEEIEQWAKEKYPGIWAELEKIGTEFDEEEGRRLFKIDRSLTP